MARGNNLWDIPDYAWPVCQDWDHYVDACKCFGIHPLTVTAHPSTTTVTVTASNAITTTVSTLTTTQTNTVPVTGTTSATFTAVIEVIASVTTTQTVTAASTVVVTTTTSPTVTSTQSCKPTGVPFRASEYFQDGQRYLDAVGIGYVAWVNFGPSNPNPYVLQITTFVLDNNGFLELATPLNPGEPDMALYIDLQLGVTATEQMFFNSQPLVEADAPDYVRLKGCIDPVTDILYLSAAGRSNILECCEGAYISLGDGTDFAPDCVLVAPITE